MQLFWIIVFLGSYVALWFFSIPLALVLTIIWAVMKLSDL